MEAVTVVVDFKMANAAVKTFIVAIERFEKQKNPEFYEYSRDSVVKRFEYTLEVFWKYLKEQIENNHKIVLVVISPKGVFRNCLNLKIIDDQEFEVLLNMVDDRNLTSHSYNEAVAVDMAKNAREYYELIAKILNRVG